MNRTMITAAGCALAALALTPGAATASPAGDLDPSFDADGKRFLPQPRLANEVLLQADGKILVVGDGGPDNDFVVTRLNTDGSLDRSFDGDGTAVADFGNQEHALSAALQPDGKIVVGGESQSSTANTLAVARFTPQGELDATFDPGGADGDGKKLLTTPPGQPSQIDARAVLIQPDGRIVLVGSGYADQYEMAVTRLTPAGEVDGTTWERGTFGTSADPAGAALTADGKVIVAGRSFATQDSDSEIAVARFERDGKLDKTLGGTGKITFASAGDEEPSAVLVQPDGKIVVAGTSYDESGVFTMTVTRFTVGGAPDTSWNGDGRAFADFDGGSLGAAAALQPDGKVVVAGVSAGEIDMAAARFNPNGSLDPSFGFGGRSSVPGGFVEAAYAVALQPDGRIVLTGASATGAPVARLLADPPPSAPAPPGGAPGTGDRTAPLLSRLRLTHRRFPLGTRPPRLQTGSATRRNPQIRFTLSEPARVRFSFQRARRGGYRRVPGRFAINAPAGTSRVRFQGRLTARRRLASGRYRLIATPVDQAGNTGRARGTTFRLLTAGGRR